MYIITTLMLLINLDPRIHLSVSSGTMAHVFMEIDVKNAMFAGHVHRLEKWARPTRQLRIKVQILTLSKIISIPSSKSFSGLSSISQSGSWSIKDFLKVHEMVRSSGMYNFQACKIPIPTVIRYDRIREALGNDISPKEERVLKLLEFGMPIDCKSNYGVEKRQKNH